MKKTILFIIIKVLIISIIIVICTHIFGFQIIKSNNMNPIIKPGCLILYYKLGHEYKKDDVITINKQIYRVIGVYKDIIKIENNQLFINDVKEEDKIYYDKKLNYHLNKDEYFVLNDNRKDINDSRSFGIINTKKINGIVIAKIQIRNF